MKKHLFLKSLLVAIGLLVTSLTTQVWAWSAGINSSNGANLDFRLDGKTDFTMTVSSSGVSDYSTQTVRSSLILRHAYIRTWKDKTNGNVCHMYLHYRIYKSGGSKLETWRTIELGNSRQIADENNQIKQEWYNTSLDIDLADGTDPGTWYFEYFFTGDGAHDGKDNCGDGREFTYSNGGDNYKIPFTVGYDTRCSMSATNKFLFQNHSKITNLYAYTDGSGDNLTWPGKAVTSYTKIIGKYRVFDDGSYNSLILNDGNGGDGHQSGSESMSELNNNFWFFGSEFSHSNVYESPLRISYNHYGVIWGELVKLKIAWNNSGVPNGTYSVSVTGATVKSGGSGSITGNTGSVECWIQLPKSGSDGTYIPVTITYIVDGITFTIPSAIYVMNPITIKVRDDVGFNNIYLQEKTLNGVVWQTWPGDLQESLGKDANGKEWYLVRLNPTLTGFWLNNGSSNKQTYDGSGWGMSIGDFSSGEVRQLLLGTGDNTPYEEHCWLGSADPSLGVALYRIESYNGTNIYHSNAVALDATGEDAVMSFYADLNNGSSTYKLKSMAANATSWSQVADIAKGTLTAVYDKATATAPGNVFTAKLNDDHNGIDSICVYKNDSGYVIHCGATTENYLLFGEGRYGTTGTSFIYFTPNPTIFGNELFNHYWVDWFGENKTVVATVGNKYNADLANVIGADLMVPDGVAVRTSSASAELGGNVRFGYNPQTNYFSRSIVAGGGNKITIQGDHVTPDGGDAGDEAHFNDASAWVYTISASVKGEATADVTTTYNGVEQKLADGQQLLGGETADDYDVVITYDFKTNRLLAAWKPNGPFEGFDLQSNLMVVRRENGAPTVLNIRDDDEDGEITPLTNITKIYTVLEITQNNWKKDGGNADRRIVSSGYIDEYYWISLPYECLVRDIFGFEGYGSEGSWVLQTYRGDLRAKSGWWAETNAWWYDLDRTDTLKANEGYVLRVTNLNGENGMTKRFAGSSDGVLSLFFPSNANNLTIAPFAQETITTHLDTMRCRVWRKWDGDPSGNKGENDPIWDRRAIDSNWRVIGSPSFDSTKIVAPTFPASSYDTNGDGIISEAELAAAVGEGSVFGLKYFYTWRIDNSRGEYTPTFTVTSTTDRTIPATHAYLVQYEGDIKWVKWNNSNPLVVIQNPPAAAPKRSMENETEEQTLRLVLKQGERDADITYISRMAFGATMGYDLNMDLSKMINANSANIYTLGELYKMAGNCIPDTVTTLQVGVQLAADGVYTFAMPDGTYGTGVVLIDKIAGTRTNLALTDYTVNLTAGTYDDRFELELSPIANTPTNIETISDERLEISGVRKVMIDGVLYIVKDDVVFDAQGNRVK